MTRFLATAEKPEGWKLEDILTEIQNDVLRRSFKVVDDHRPEARTVLSNNYEILRLLDNCIEKAKNSTQVLNGLGPSKGPDGPPRIGHL